ncbi:MAG: methyltransferase domain-containing protein [Actinobacteria bacterium]|nr:methyltransferase domain-containing protein [Actinomycetota bacterium]
MVRGVTPPDQRSVPRLIAESYDLAASRFAGAADQQVYRLLAAPLAEAVGRVADTSGATVLDVAAGSGAVGRHFARAVAVDVSVEQLRRNGARLRVRADGERLPFRGDSFTAAVCGFGVNHVADPGGLVREMARVAPVVGVSTWQRPEPPYPPKQVVFDILVRRAGRPRSAVGELVDRYGDSVGSVAAIAALLGAAGLESRVDVVEVEVPWPGIDAYLDYRLSMPTSAPVVDDADLRAELRHALGALSPASLAWHAGIVVGVGRRRP